MSEFSFRSDNVDVERIMQQIRQRIREKRGADYTEEQVRELASVKLERFLDPGNVRSDLTEHFRRSQASGPRPAPMALPPLGDRPQPAELLAFDHDIIYRSSRGALGKLLYLIRRGLNPILKLFFNPNPIVHALHRQHEINERLYEQMDWIIHTHREQNAFLERIVREFELVAKQFAKREELDKLSFEVLNNLVVEMTRLAIDMKNHRMRVESIAGRLDFDERRARALESVVQYRASTPGLPPAAGSPAASEDEAGAGGDVKRRRRRRRGRRRSGAPGSPQDAESTPGATDAPEAGGATTSSSEPDDEPETSES
jgi:hypothetical protein